jgi:hypothetical protein
MTLRPNSQTGVPKAFIANAKSLLAPMVCACKWGSNRCYRFVVTII